MGDCNFYTWRSIRAFLDRLDDAGREPDPWEAHFMTEALDSLRRSDGDPALVEVALLPVGQRLSHHDEAVTSEADDIITKSDLRAAFLALPVPGGHPA
jgi:hypothetical protein